MNPRIVLTGFAFAALLAACTPAPTDTRPRVLVSTDIGGSDPDDFQSMVHLLVYADRFQIEGLVSSPPHAGRDTHIYEVLDAYAADFPKLRNFSADYPHPDSLRARVRQGAMDAQQGEFPNGSTPGSRWIIQCAQSDTLSPLYVLVWGSITDVAQAVADAPGIKPRIRVYSIGSWNTRLDSNSRNYLYTHHPDLWWIENNTTFRGMYLGAEERGPWSNEGFVATHVRGKGRLGDLFWEKKKDIKMGDTPSVLYLLHGDSGNPEGESWGGTFRRTDHGPHFWTDIPGDSFALGDKYGAKTVLRHRQAFLRDWAARMERLR